MKHPGVITARNDEGQTLLYLKAQVGDVESVALLLGKGADVNAKDDAGTTPLHAAALRCCLCGDEKTEQITKSTRVAALLLRNGADLNAADEHGNTPLITVASVSHVDGDGTKMAKLLLDKGADVNVRNKDGDTPLMTAARSSQLDGDYLGLAKILLSTGAGIQVKNNAGFTAIDYARSRHNKSLAELLTRAAHHTPRHGN